MITRSLEHIFLAQFLGPYYKQTFQERIVK